jgi:hypothetical protein
MSRPSGDHNAVASVVAPNVNRLAVPPEESKARCPIAPHGVRSGHGDAFSVRRERGLCVNRRGTRGPEPFSLSVEPDQLSVLSPTTSLISNGPVLGNGKGSK